MTDSYDNVVVKQESTLQVPVLEALCLSFEKALKTNFAEVVNTAVLQLLESKGVVFR